MGAFHLGLKCWVLVDMKNVLVYDSTEGLLEKLAVEALQVAMVSISQIGYLFYNLNVKDLEFNLLHLIRNDRENRKT
jgi:hypothetical protein